MKNDKLIPDSPSPLEEEFQHEFTELIDQYKKDFLTHGWSAKELAKWCKEMVDKELRESEDEMALRIIRKRMCYDPVPISDEDRRIVENWLEKQKESENTSASTMTPSCWAEEPSLQKEHKPNIELIQRSWYMAGYNDRKFGNEPKWIIKTGKGGPKHELNPKYGQPLADEQKPEWSEEDTLMLTAIIQTLERFGGRGTTGMQIDWLKSLRPSWKPSEEQMEALDRCVDYLDESDNEDAGIIESLHEQLKQL